MGSLACISCNKLCSVKFEGVQYDIPSGYKLLLQNEISNGITAESVVTAMTAVAVNNGHGWLADMADMLENKIDQPEDKVEFR